MKQNNNTYYIYFVSDIVGYRTDVEMDIGPIN